MEDSSIPYKFGLVWAVNATTDFITSPVPETTGSTTAASQSLGFPPGTFGATGTPPNGADVNGPLNYLSSWAQWFQAGAPLFYDATFSTNIGGYPKGSMLLAAGATNWWFSTADNNASDPDTGGSNWVFVPIVAGFPVSAPSVNTSGTIGATLAGSFVIVSGSSTTQTIASSGWVAGSSVGFSARASCAVAIAGGGTFQGGILTGATSVAMAAGQYIAAQFDGTNWQIFCGSANLIQPHGRQIFTTSGTFTVPTGVTLVTGRVWGGGGGSGGTNGTNSASAPGAGGGYSEDNLPVTPAQTITVTVGTGGSGGNTTPTNGTAGGDSAFGTITATGGAGGLSASSGIQTTLSNPGAGTTSSSTAFNVDGNTGNTGIPLGGNDTFSAQGGASYGVLPAHAGYAGGSAGGIPGNPPGGGASGSVNQANGAAGAAGLVIVEW